MADSHLPNSQATPDWRELPYPRTSFDQAISLTPVDGSTGLYKGYAPRDWCSPHDHGSCLHGGYICSLFIAGSRQFFRSQHADLNQPDPVGMHVQFLELVPQGAFHLSFTVVKLRPRNSVIQAELISADPAVPKTYTLAICTMGDLNKTRGESEISLPQDPIPTPNRDTECVRWAPGFFFFLNPPTSACRVYTPKGGPDPIWSPAVGRNKRDQWEKLDNGENFRLEHLGLIGDLIPSLPLNYEKNALKAVLKYTFPTVSLTFDFVSDPAGQKEWILNRATMNRLRDGRFDMDVQMVDEEGALVATVKHQCVMFAHKRGGQNKSSL